MAASGTYLFLYLVQRHKVLVRTELGEQNLLHNTLVLIIGGVGLIVDQARPSSARFPPVVWLSIQANWRSRLRPIVELNELLGHDTRSLFQRS